MKELPEELEGVVKDLWSLRVRDLVKRREERGFGSVSGRTWFSSQSEGEDTDGTKSVSSKRSRKSEVGSEVLPKLVETLAFCYLGTLLMRLPATLGDFYIWATKEEISYNRAASKIFFGI